MTYIKVKFDEHSEEGQYFIRCAQIREISLAGLFSKLQDVIAKDQLVLSILDDDSKPIDKNKGQHRRSYLGKRRIGKPTSPNATVSVIKQSDEAELKS